MIFSRRLAVTIFNNFSELGQINALDIFDIAAFFRFLSNHKVLNLSIYFYFINFIQLLELCILKDAQVQKSALTHVLKTCTDVQMM